MKKITLFLFALLLAASPAMSQAVAPGSLQEHLSRLLAPYTIPAGDNGYFSKAEMLKRVQTVAILRWDEATNDWSTDTLQWQDFEWHSDGNIKAMQIYTPSDFGQIRVSLTDFVPYEENVGEDFGTSGNFWPTKILVEVNVFNSWAPIQRMTYTIDGDLRLRELLTEQYQLPTWVKASRVVYLYDAEDNFNGFEAYVWDTDKWVLSQGEKNTYTYVFDGHVSKVVQTTYNVADDTWDETYMEEYRIRLDGTITDATTYSKDSLGEWMPMDSFVDIRWHTFDPKIMLNSEGGLLAVGGHDYSSMIAYSRDTLTKEWNEPVKHTRTFTNNRLTEEVLQEYVGGTYVNSDRTTYTYYMEDSTEKEVVYYEWITGVWERTGGMETINTYDADGDLLISIVRSDNGGNVTYESKSIYTYSTFAGLAEKHAAPSLAMYPNPADDVLNIVLPEGAGPVSVLITDMTGRVISAGQGILENTMLRVNVADLPAGTYLLQVRSGEVSWHNRFIRQ
ncbi:MAG: T9SS type A sorting domain-containing protein [Bacteroidota bacterium]|nr:T9SS type A sorting domain-containing protein [Bacteroidota bacterium]